MNNSPYLYYEKILVKILFGTYLGISSTKDIFRLAPDPEIAEIGSWTGSFDLLFQKIFYLRFS